MKIASGAVGCVYHPPLRCRVPCTTAACTQGVSKLMAPQYASHEMRNNGIVDAVDPSGIFHPVGAHSCEADPNQDFEGCSGTQLVIYPHVGIELYSMLYEGGLPADSWRQLLDQLSVVFYAVQQLSANGLTHFDVKTDNILLDPKTYRMRLIDYGLLMVQHTGAATFDASVPRLHYPPDIVLLSRDPSVIPQFAAEYLDDPNVGSLIYGGQPPTVAELSAYLSSLLSHPWSRLHVIQTADSYSLGWVLKQVVLHYAALPPAIEDELNWLTEQLMAPLWQRLHPLSALPTYLDILDRHGISGPMAATIRET